MDQNYEHLSCYGSTQRLPVIGFENLTITTVERDMQDFSFVTHLPACSAHRSFMLVAQRQRVMKIDLAEANSSMVLPLIGVEVTQLSCFPCFNLAIGLHYLNNSVDYHISRKVLEPI